MKIRSKLLINTVATIFCLVAIGSIGSFYTHNVAEVSQSLVKEQAKPIFEINKLEEIAWQMWLRLVVHTSTPNMEIMAQLEQEITELEKELRKQMEIMENLHASREHKKSAEKALDEHHTLELTDFREYWATFWKNAQQILEFSQNFMKEDAALLIVGEGREAFNESLNSLQKIVQEHHEEMDISSRHASETREQAILMIIVLTVIFVIIVSAFIYFINRDILRQVGGEPADIAKITEKVAAGNLDVEFDDRKKETGIYASIKLMVNNLKKIQVEREAQNWLKTGQMELSEIMSGEQAIETLAKKIITFLTTYVNAQIGLFYLIADDLEHGSEDEKAILKRIADYAYTANENVPSEFGMGDGFVGQAALEKKTLLRTYKATEYQQITQSGLTNAVPRTILFLPFLYEGEVKGVIEIGSSKELTAVQRDFLEQVLPTIGIAVNTTESRDKMQFVLMQLQEQSEEMRQQQEELRQTNEQLESRASDLEKNEKKWKVH